MVEYVCIFILQFISSNFLNIRGVKLAETSVESNLCFFIDYPNSYRLIIPYFNNLAIVGESSIKK